MKKQVRLGIIGLGGMGQYHANYLREGMVKRVKLAAVADSDPARLASQHDVSCFPDAKALIRSGEVDAVLIATPHYAHVPAGVAALKAGLHVLMEKPIAVDVADAEKLLDAYLTSHPRRELKFAAMFNQRTDPRFEELRRMVHSGELGEIQRISWTITDWFRSNAYYAAGGWRATWAGEGGGVLLNQCPHNLDILQWIFGMPDRVRAICRFGRHHPIEVEDDVSACLEYANGSYANFVASTGEAPGVNRLEVAGDCGLVVIENRSLRHIRNTIPASKFSRTTKERMTPPPTHEEKLVGFDGPGGQHVAITQNFIDAILDGKPLIAPADEGMHSVELANAMLLSAWTDRPVELPISGATYRRWLRRKIAESKVATLRK